MKPYVVTGEVLDIKGLQSVTLTLNGREFTHAFLVCALPTDAACLMGIDFLEKESVVIDFSAVRCLLPASAMCCECLAFHLQGTQHSLSSQRVKLDAAPSSVYRRRGIKPSRPHPNPIPRSIRNRAKHD